MKGSLEAEVEAIRSDWSCGADELAERGLKLLGKTRSAEEAAEVVESLRGARPAMAPIGNYAVLFLAQLQNGRSNPKKIADSLLAKMKADRRQLVTAAAAVLSEMRSVLTLSWSSTIVEILQQTPCRVIIAESRPAFEGRRVFQQLKAPDRSLRMITDAQMGRAMAEVDALLLGADTIRSDLTVINKTGSLMAALAARHYSKPTLVCALTSKINVDESVGLEKRPGEEVWKQEAEACDNIPFETVPERLIERFITEKGVLTREQMRREVDGWRKMVLGPAAGTVPRVLTIAGSDSGGGAGIQADLKTFAALGVYGTSAVTAVTAQDTQQVHLATELPLETIEKQIDAVIGDIGADAVKTGMLPTKEIISLVAKKMKQHKVRHLVVDPVMVSQGGDSLISDDALAAMVRDLFPLATVVTPNLPEAERLYGRKIEDPAAAARAIQKMGPAAVVIKGGHAEGPEAIDTVFDGKEVYTLRSERIDTRNTHGSGCTFASAVAAHLARGLKLKDALSKSKEYVTEAIRRSISIGKGSGPLGHFG